jgi:hypothetical protein
MRKILLVALGVTVAVTLALPAQAKMAGSATISGPGIPGSSGGTGDSGGSIHLDGSDGNGYPVLAGMVEPARFLTTRPNGDLGPRYEARLSITAPKGQPEVVQHVYPFASGGPVLFTPPGQEFVMSPTGEAPDGWYRIPSALIGELRDRGFPRTAPVVTPPRPEPVTGPAPGPGVPPGVWGIGLLLGLVLIGVLAGRRRAAVRRAA